MTEITIIDYGLGNIGSIQNMFRKVEAETVVASDPEQILQAKKLLLPGVGHFDRAIERIHSSNLLPALEEKVLKQKVPILGICLGMQLLTKRSEEGKLDGLGWIPAYTKKFRLEGNSRMKIPHMGWNKVHCDNASKLTEDFDSEYRFYFVHSYHAVVDEPKYSLLSTEYGYSFSSGIFKDNIYGVQFHPEKSHRFGKALFRQFANL